jgi:hypothetical protein
MTIQQVLLSLHCLHSCSNRTHSLPTSCTCNNTRSTISARAHATDAAPATRERSPKPDSASLTENASREQPRWHFSNAPAVLERSFSRWFRSLWERERERSKDTIPLRWNRWSPLQYDGTLDGIVITHLEYWGVPLILLCRANVPNLEYKEYRANMTQLDLEFQSRRVYSNKRSDGQRMYRLDCMQLFESIQRLSVPYAIRLGD